MGAWAVILPYGRGAFLGDSTYTQTVDNATRAARVDWDRDMKYPAVERLKYSEITTPTFGILIDDKGVQHPMSGIRLAAHWRERERASPRLLVRALAPAMAPTNAHFRNATRLAD